MAGVGSHRHFYERVTNDVLGRSAKGHQPERFTLIADRGQDLVRNNPSS